MGIEARGRGRNRYMYIKKRIGSKVVSEYAGSARLAELLAKGIELRKDIAATLQELEQERLELIDDSFQLVENLNGAVEAQFERAMNDLGYRRHKRGEWRKQRNGP